MAHPRGFEPLTSAFGVCRTNNLLNKNSSKIYKMPAVVN